MSRYLIRRVLLAIPTLLMISFVLYAVLALAPGDPLSQFAANPAVPPEVRENIRRSLGLDQPWPVRYVKWFVSMLQVNNFETLGMQLKQSIMPIAVLGLFQTATVVRYMRASVLETLPQD